MWRGCWYTRYSFFLILVNLGGEIFSKVTKLPSTKIIILNWIILNWITKTHLQKFIWQVANIHSYLSSDKYPLIFVKWQISTHICQVANIHSYLLSGKHPLIFVKWQISTHICQVANIHSYLYTKQISTIASLIFVVGVHFNSWIREKKTWN